MAINTLENGWVQDVFEFTHDQYGTYCDAIVMPPEDYNALPADELAAMKQQRFDNWVAHITEASNTPPDEAA